MKVKSYQLERLSHLKFLHFMRDALVFIDNHSEGMPKSYTNECEELRTAFDICNKEVMLQRRISTSDVFEAEELRDYDIRKIYSIIYNYSDYRYDKQKEEAAKALMFIFRRYGTGYTISRMPQDTQGALMISLLQELEREAAQQHIATLHLTEVMSALKESQNYFEESQKRRRKKEAHYVTGVVKDARKDLTIQFLEFVDIVNALATLEGEQKYFELKLTMNELIKKNVTTARQQKRKQLDDDEEL